VLQLELLDARPAAGWARREVTRRQTLLGVTWAALAGVSAGVTSVVAGSRDLHGAGWTDPQRLWRTDPRKPGPLAPDKAASSTALVGDFTNHNRHVIYTYEHHALRLVAEGHAAGDDDVVALRPRPATRLTQYLLVLSSRGRAVAERMASPQGREALLAMGLRIPREQGVVTARVEQLHRDADALVRRLEQAGHPLTLPVTWQPRPVDLDKDVVTGLVDLYVADHPAASGNGRVGW
jgi:hypothetical protein